jgi:hypothetical protein
MSDINRGTYVSLHLTHKSAQRLWKWGKSQGIESIFEPSDFHITVCYSKHPLPFIPLERLPPLPVKPIGFDLFGKDKDYLVMKVESKLAHARHATARALGAAHDFPDYRPHISLAKGGKMPALKDLEDFPDLLFVNRESVSTLNPSFKPDAPQYVDGPFIKQVMTPRLKTDAEIQAIYERVSSKKDLLYHVAHARR